MSPVDKPPISSNGRNNLYHQTDTAPGQSGLPAFLGDVNQSVDIHTAGELGEKNGSARITESLFSIISQVRR